MAARVKQALVLADCHAPHAAAFVKHVCLLQARIVILVDQRYINDINPAVYVRRPASTHEEFYRASPRGALGVAGAKGQKLRAPCGL